MRKQVLIYGLLGGVLIALLKVVEYRYLVIERSYEIYGGAIAVLFAALGIWLGVRMTGRKERIVVHQVPAPREFVRDDEKLSAIGMTKRELEMLELLALGLSNREIAERVFLSENTVKTHLTRVFEKLGARRRTQAVQLGKQLRLIP